MLNLSNVTGLDLLFVNNFASASINAPFYVEIYPPLIVLAPSNSTKVEISAWDASWNPINVAGHSVTFTSYSPQTVSVTDAGEVTALAAHSSYNEYACIMGSVDGVLAQNWPWVVVLPKESLDKVGGFKTFNGAHTAFYVPINGYNRKIADYFEDLECAKVNDAAYDIIHQLFGSVPYEGAKTWIMGLPIDGEFPWYAGISGNPVVIPYDLNSGRNGLISDANDPNWWLFWHELGHDFLLNSEFDEYNMLFGSGNVNTGYYSEGLVVLGATYVQNMIAAEGGGYNLADNSISSVSKGLSSSVSLAEWSLSDWKNTGSDLSTVGNPTSAGWMLTGKLLEVGDKYGWDIFPGFFELLHKAGQQLADNQIQSAGIDGKNAVFLALLSNAADYDLRDEFKDVNFPIDTNIFQIFLDISTYAPPHPIIDQGTASKVRCNVGSTQTVEMHLKWSDVDTDAVGLKIEINGEEYVTNSIGWVNIQERYDSPTKRTYEVSSIQDYFNYETEISPLSIIWDSVDVVLSLNNDRIDVGSAVDIQWTAEYKYDSTPFIGQVYVNSPSAIQVGSFICRVDRIVDPAYEITSFTANEVTVIFDRISLNITPVKSRIDVGTYPQINYSGTYAYDSQPFKGTVILNNPPTVSKIGSFTYAVTGVVDPIYGLKMYFANRATCVWDRVKIVEAGVTSNVVKANEPVTVWCKAVYEYDNELFDGSKGSIYVNDQSLVWSSTNQRWEKEFVSAQPKSTSFKVTGMQERKYGLMTLNDATSPLSVEWTQAGIPGYPTEAMMLGLVLVILTYAWGEKSLKRGLPAHANNLP